MFLPNQDRQLLMGFCILIQQDQIIAEIHEISNFRTLEYFNTVAIMNAGSMQKIGENILESWNSKFHEFWQ